MRLLVFGRTGQVATELARRLPPGISARFLSRAEADLADPAACAAAVAGAGADAVINAAAWTAVDAAEAEEAAATVVNGAAPAAMAQACAARGLPFLQVSTDYVFDGTARRPYREDDPTGPRSVYGQTKLEGEARARAAHPDALVVRTAWLFGPGRNFVRTILEAAERAWRGAGPPLRVVDDQRGSPTWAGHLADALLLLVERDARGIYHAANSGSATWWELARAAVDAWGHPELPIEKVTTAAFPRPAPRPAWSVLDLAKAERAGVRMPSWAEGLHAYLASPGGSA